MIFFKQDEYNYFHLCLAATCVTDQFIGIAKSFVKYNVKVIFRDRTRNIDMLKTNCFTLQIPRHFYLRERVKKNVELYLSIFNTSICSMFNYEHQYHMQFITALDIVKRNHVH